MIVIKGALPLGMMELRISLIYLVGRDDTLSFPTALRKQADNLEALLEKVAAVRHDPFVVDESRRGDWYNVTINIPSREDIAEPMRTVLRRVGKPESIAVRYADYDRVNAVLKEYDLKFKSSRMRTRKTIAYGVIAQDEPEVVFSYKRPIALVVGASIISIVFALLSPPGCRYLDKVVHRVHGTEMYHAEPQRYIPPKKDK